MNCKRCGKKIRKAYYVNGKPYGIECAKIRGYLDKKIKINRQTEENKNQWDLFYENR